jgi:formamidopyrimidine-DNA glycosylase
VPEIVEVERARALIAERALGRVVAAVDDTDDFVCRPHAAGEIDAALRGRTITAACRRGKHMWLETDAGTGPELGLHLGMSGRILIDPAAPPRHGRARIEFADGGALWLRDPRRLGRMVLDPDHSRIGPDAAEVTREAFRRRVGQGTAPLKARLMDQAVIAGVGNLLADEVLWQAGQDPHRPAGALSVPELDALRRHLRAGIRRATRLGGVHTGVVIPHRRPGGECPRCGAEMARGVVGGRTTWWCAAEQGAAGT